MEKYTIGRYINGVTLNPLEYLLDETNKPMEFPNKEEAIQFLRDNQCEDIDNYTIEPLVI